MKRSSEKEWIDLGSDFYTEEEYVACMRKLFRINKLLGFFRTTQCLLKQFSNVHSVMDVGCGDGEFVLQLSHSFPSIQFVGVDISEEAISIAKTKSSLHKNIVFELQHLPPQPNSVDVVMTTLVCHHIDGEDLITFIRNLFHTAKQAVIINDLHRHFLAYHLFRLISPLFGSRLIYHDGLLSIKRSFIKKEWEDLFEQAGISHYQIKWKFPFRWNVILWKK